MIGRGEGTGPMSCFAFRCLLWKSHRQKTPHLVDLRYLARRCESWFTCATLCSVTDAHSTLRVFIYCMCFFFLMQRQWQVVLCLGGRQTGEIISTQKAHVSCQPDFSSSFLTSLSSIQCVGCHRHLRGAEYGVQVRIRNRKLYCEPCYFHLKGECWPFLWKRWPRLILSEMHRSSVSVLHEYSQIVVCNFHTCWPGLKGQFRPKSKMHFFSSLSCSAVNPWIVLTWFAEFWRHRPSQMSAPSQIWWS